MIFPWHTAQWKALQHAKSQHRLPQALLFVGMAGIGKTQFADRFSRVLLCQQNLSTVANQDETYCGACHACHLTADRVHPNVLWITPEKEGQAIKIDQVRMVSEFVQHSSLQQGDRIVIIHPAHAMNMNAANALLKTLEEPSSGSVIILISHQAGSLPATVLSRCQRIPFSRPKKEEAYAWLKAQMPNHHATHVELLLTLVHGAPLSALALAQDDVFNRRKMCLQSLYLLSQKQGDPVKLAAELQDMDTVPLLNLILTWTIDLIWLQLGVGQDKIINQDFLSQLLELKQWTPLMKNNQFIHYLKQIREQIVSGINLNKSLLIEDILIRWMQISYFRK